jgi:chorismate synthase
MFPPSAADGDQGMGVTRRTNRAGGVEGGMTNGAPLVVRVGMKPLPTLMRPLATVDLATGEAATAHAERSDTCAIAAAAVALECAIAFELARVVREQFGAQALVDVEDAFGGFRDRVRFPVRQAIQLA